MTKFLQNSGYHHTKDRSHFVLEAALDGLSWVDSDRERTKNPGQSPSNAESEIQSELRKSGVECAWNAKKTEKTVATAAAAQAHAVDPL